MEPRGGLTAREIATATGRSLSRTYRLLRRMEKTGHIVKIPPRGATRAAKWSCDSKPVIIREIEWCVDRIRQERQDYATAADDVASELRILADWLTASWGLK